MPESFFDAIMLLLPSLTHRSAYLDKGRHWQAAVDDQIRLITFATIGPAAAASGASHWPTNRTETRADWRLATPPPPARSCIWRLRASSQLVKRSGANDAAKQNKSMHALARERKRLENTCEMYPQR